MTHCRLSNGFGTTPKSKPPAWMGVHKTVNGAYRYRYAPFLMPTYYAAGRSPLALPLGELSPQVTERGLQSLFTLSDLTAFGHLSHRERQDALSVLAALGHLSQRESQEKLSYDTRPLAGGILCLNRKDRPAPWWHRRSGPAPPGGPPDTRSTPGRRSWPRCRRRGSEAAGTGGIRPCRRPAADRSG